MSAKAKMVKRCRAAVNRRNRRRQGNARLTPYEVVERHFPGSSEELKRFIISSLTGWPAFWHIPKDGNTPYQCFKKQIARAAARQRRGESLDRQVYEAWDKPLLDMIKDRLNEIEARLDQMSDDEVYRALREDVYVEVAHVSKKEAIQLARQRVEERERRELANLERLEARASGGTVTA